ncbi:LysR substrate-binding domain-containing protein [Burkholderia gladioli]|uniref:LysR substrate-binding domain-containing protein n=1 Tax=Burkholderia gladioli TaxID=28095 RepID=UPI00264E50DF|nr:LysR substrate-binding domain-containing protein [Burkholderia gladioli]MDN7751126.1 LysR substrate-binding domain-containing protein [Burkholderia gladioli]
MKNEKRLKILNSLDFLRGFESAARHLSFTRAGQELDITQSAVSRQVKALEEQLSVELFHRHIRALSLTEHGHVFYAAISGALAEIEAAIWSFSSGGVRRSISLSTTVPFAALWLIPRLGSFTTRHPEIDVHVSTARESEDLSRKRLDLVVRFVPARMSLAQARPLFHEHGVAVASPALAATLRAPRDLERHVLLHVDDAGDEWPWLAWKSFLSMLGVPPLRQMRTLHFTQYDQVIQAALDGHGVALGRRPLVDRLLARGRLVELFPEYTVDAGRYVLVENPETSQRADVTMLRQWLLQESQQQGVPARAGGRGGVMPGLGEVPWVASGS